MQIAQEKLEPAILKMETRLLEFADQLQGDTA